MARITRFFLKTFAGNAINNGQFGSAQVGTKVLSSNPTTLQALAAWLNGWDDAVISGQRLPTLEEMQAVQYVHSLASAYLYQEGLPEWNADTTYYQNSIVKKTGTYELYGSKIDTNLNHALPSQIDNTQWQYLGDLAEIVNIGTGTRTRLSGNATYYVSTTGNNANDGSIGSPWATIQYALDYVANNIDISGYDVQVNVASGTYAQAILLDPFVGNGSVTLNGDTTTPSNVIISATGSGCIQVQNGVNINVQGFKFVNSIGSGITAYGRGSQVNISGKVDFGACGAGHIISDSAHVIASAAYTISGNAPSHIYANTSGVIEVGAVTITLTGTPAFATAFAVGISLGDIAIGGATFSGSATGARYSATLNSVINTSGGGASYLPGNSAGSTATGGQYA